MSGPRFGIGLALGLLWTFIIGVDPACAHIAVSPFDRWAMKTPRMVNGIVLETPVALATATTDTATSASTLDTKPDPDPDASIPVMTFTLVRASSPASIPGEDGGNSTVSKLTSAPVQTDMSTSNELTSISTENISTVPTMTTSVATSSLNGSSFNDTGNYAKWTISPALATSQASFIDVSREMPVAMAIGSLLLVWAFFA
ncbi:hypothetical protein PV10_07437 [Exophiala mesophila]|uniref:Uncharacterized protein n=1 Tax=Exophiala mesophila TaxID=212818 RepID=A0A0D1XPR6_EXOME|nr:uncharacterized protein PV10_07437 [Exophiala mesophila]KIV90096.1 hypothetical protein PV10_07437 [Exophiala mesophila]